MQKNDANRASQVSAVPRNTRISRAFYWAFRDELNFGYRELLSKREFSQLLRRGGYAAGKILSSPSTCVACSTVSR